MPYSKTDVWNLALANIGEVTRSKIESPGEDTSDANVIRRFYDVALDSFLDSHHWAWATKYAALSQDSSDPVDGWAYTYKQPADCIAPRAIVIGTPDNAPEFITAVTAGGLPVIYSSWTDAVLEYTVRTEDFNAWGPLGVRAFALFLGMEIAPAYTGGRRKAASIRLTYERALDEARHASHVMQRPRDFTEDIFTSARQ